MAAYMMGQAEVARAAFQQAANTPADFPGKEEAQRRLVLLKNGGSAEVSIADLEGLLKQHPNDPVAWMRLGEAYEKQDAFPKADEAYERALKENPKLLVATVKVAQLNAGPLHNTVKAFEFAKKARELAPADPQVAANLGAIAYQTGNFTWAYSLLQESARLRPDDASILRDYAWAAYSLGKMNEARQTMQRVLKASPDSRHSEDAKSFLAMTGLDGKPADLAAAEPQVQKILKADANYVPALMAQAAIQVQGADSKSATATYTAVLRRFPDFALAQKHLAVLYAKDPNNIAQAYDLAMKARKTLADDPELAEILAEISYQKKEYPRALQLLQESARTRPLDAKGLYYLGMSHLQGRQKSEGREALNKAVAAGLQEPQATEAKRALAELERE
jgi:tetratricopeptide (TPR) repeat protein